MKAKYIYIALAVIALAALSYYLYTLYQMSDYKAFKENRNIDFVK